MLLENGIQMKDVYIFLSDLVDFTNYQQVSHLGVNLIYHGPLPDIVTKFNFIHDYFEPGERVLFVEDDISELRLKWDDEKLHDFTELTWLAEDMFGECEKKNTKLWGISSNANPFYMKKNNEKSYGFKFVVANMFGFISTRDPFLRISQFCKSDYERTLLYFIKYGGICRADGICAITKNYKNPGGLQELKDHRAIMETNACQYLVKRFPHLIQINEKKSTTSKYMEVKMKTIRKKELGFTDWMGLQKQLDLQIQQHDLRSKDTLVSL